MKARPMELTKDEREALEQTAAMQAVWLLENAGFEAWLVGGCLRDCLLGREFHDVDITTSALPRQIEEVFSDFRLIETGIAHGTVTVWIEGEPLEITTYRRDGDYGDHRRPDGVTFTGRIEEDLARRDFTVNAMAWNPVRGFCDPFGGREDLRYGRLRCVGQAERRFQEDALRILRGIRFAAVYGFAVEEETERAMRGESRWLSFVSAERVWTELKRTLASVNAAGSVGKYADIWRRALPGFPAVSLDDVRRMERLMAVEGAAFAAEDDDGMRMLLRLALLLKGYAMGTERLADQAKMSRREKEILTAVARLWNHELPQDDGRWKRWIYTDGYDAVLGAVALRYAREEDGDRCEELLRRIELWRETDECVTIGQLAIDGTVLMERGIPRGKIIKAYLERALFAVMDGAATNEREDLLRYLEL